MGPGSSQERACWGLPGARADVSGGWRRFVAGQTLLEEEEAEEEDALAQAVTLLPGRRPWAPDVELRARLCPFGNLLAQLPPPLLRLRSRGCHPPSPPGASLDRPPGPTAPRSCCGTWSSLAPTQAWSFAGIPGRAAWLCAGTGKASLGKRSPGTSAGTRIQPRGDFAGGAAEGDIRQGQSRASPRTPGLPGEKGLLFAGNRDFLRIYKSIHELVYE